MSSRKEHLNERIITSKLGGIGFNAVTDKAYQEYELAIKRFGFLSVERRRAYQKYLILDLAAIKEYRVSEASELISILTDNVQANPSIIHDLMGMIIEIGKGEDMEQIKNMWRRFYVHLKKIQDGTIQG